MPGTQNSAFATREIVQGYSAAAVTAAQVLHRFVATCRCRVGAVKVNAGAAGTGAGNTVMELKKNGTTMYTAAANRPTLAATSTGEFANTNPDVRELAPGDVMTLECASVSDSGHAQVSYSVALELV